MFKDKIIYTSLIIFLATNASSSEIKNYNCNKTKLNELKKIKRNLEKDLNINILINNNCKLQSESKKDYKHSMIVRDIYAEIIDYEFN